jgi:hypothetical protein
MKTALQITARPSAGFRRAGRHHPPTPTVHPPGTFSEAEIKALKDEPNLIVVEVATDAKKDETKK